MKEGGERLQKGEGRNGRRKGKLLRRANKGPSFFLFEKKNRIFKNLFVAKFGVGKGTPPPRSAFAPGNNFLLHPSPAILFDLRHRVEWGKEGVGSTPSASLLPVFKPSRRHRQSGKKESGGDMPRISKRYTVLWRKKGLEKKVFKNLVFIPIGQGCSSRP